MIDKTIYTIFSKDDFSCIRFWEEQFSSLFPILNVEEKDIIKHELNFIKEKGIKDIFVLLYYAFQISRKHNGHPRAAGYYEGFLFLKLLGFTKYYDENKQFQFPIREPLSVIVEAGDIHQDSLNEFSRMISQLCACFPIKDRKGYSACRYIFLPVRLESKEYPRICFPFHADIRDKKYKKYLIFEFFGHIDPWGRKVDEGEKLFCCGLRKGGEVSVSKIIEKLGTSASLSCLVFLQMKKKGKTYLAYKGQRDDHFSYRNGKNRTGP